jgi:hypothetical protein
MNFFACVLRAHPTQAKRLEKFQQGPCLKGLQMGWAVRMDPAPHLAINPEPRHLASRQVNIGGAKTSCFLQDALPIH